MNRIHKVLLPKRIWKQHRFSVNDFKSAIFEYMKRYPHYEVLGVDKGFIICRNKGGLL